MYVATSLDQLIRRATGVPRSSRAIEQGGGGRLYESDVSYHMLNCRDSIEICFMPYCKCNRNEYFYTRHSQVGIHPICGILFHL